MLTLIAQRLEQEYPESNKGLTVAVTRLRDEMVAEETAGGEASFPDRQALSSTCFAGPAGQCWNAACFAPK